MKKRRKERQAIRLQEPAKTVPMVSRYANGAYRLIRVFVEGYDDVAFWRSIFDDYETERLKFEISVPLRDDLAKGKKVLLAMIDERDRDTILCMDSDFDYLFKNFNDQSRLVNNTPRLFHTYAYATENFLCHPPSLHKVCVKATKNDTLIFNFEKFMTAYSRTIYPLFLWYAYSARRKSEKAFSLLDFRAASGSTISICATTAPKRCTGSAVRSKSVSERWKPTIRPGSAKWPLSGAISGSSASKPTMSIFSCRAIRCWTTWC